MNSPDLSQYLGVFLDEGQEQIDLLEAHLLSVEGGDPSGEVMQAMFRAAHTLKGSNRTMGFMRIGDLTHEMENVLDDLRNDKLALSTEVVNSLLECMDLLKSMMAAVQQAGNDESFEESVVAELVGKLTAVRSDGPAPSSTAPASAAAAPAGFSAETLSAAAAALAEEHSVYEIEVVIREDCLLKSVRVMMVLGALREQGTVYETTPGEEDLNEDRFEHTFSILFESDLCQEQVEAIFSSISELESVKVSPYDPATEKPEPPKAAKPEPKAAPTEAGGAPVQAQSTTIRVATSRLDALLNLVGELVIDRAQITRIAHGLEDQYGSGDLFGQLNEATHRIARITGELQDEIMKTRLLPIDGVFQRMPRMVRDVAQKINKQIDLRISGGETELDRSMLDVLSDPIIHLLRNSVDHGVEPADERIAAGKPPVGVVTLSASHEENHIVIEITDDGKGIDPVKIRNSALKKGIITQAQAEAMPDADAIKLIFASGFSTAAELSDISGRGVGMDIVRSNIEKIGGRIQVDSAVGLGSRFRVHLPLTLAIVRALLVRAGTASYAIPLASVVETVRLGSDSGMIPEKVNGRAVLVLRGETVPLISLTRALEADSKAGASDSIPKESYVVVIGFADSKVGLCVDHLAGEQEVVIKPLGKLLGDVPGISGASILGDGRVALIVDCARAVNQ